MKHILGGHIICRTQESVKRIALCIGLIVFLVLAPTPKVNAEDIDAVLPYVVDNHDRVRAAEARLTAARNRAREALGDWFPTLGQTANAGHERQQNDGGDDSSTGFNEYDISLTQLLWDFGSTNAAVDKARLQVEEARYSLIETKQSLILEAITAYMDLVRANATLNFAKESEENIRRQTGLEEALVDLGSGFSTDVLQSKTQLAGAQARRAQNEGALINALNRFKAVFGRMPDEIKVLNDVPYPAPYLPTSLTQSVDIALETNPALKNAILAADIAREDVRIAKADNFFPRIEASGERKFKKNVGGTIGSEQETLAKVEMTMDFNLGLTAINTLKASKSDLSASTFTAADTRRNIEEQVRNAWQQLDTARRTAAHLNNQANIAAAFLELARNERQLGRRSLIDVLSGETNLINSRSDALSAETDVVIAAYGLLAATGQLEYGVIKRSRGIRPPIFQEAPQPSAAISKKDEIGSLEDESDRSSSELMAMLQKTLKSMPEVPKPRKSNLAEKPAKSAQKVTLSIPSKAKHTTEEKPQNHRVWTGPVTQQGHYEESNVLPDDDNQIASSDTSSTYQATTTEYVPVEGDTAVSSTPYEISDRSEITPQAEASSSILREEQTETASLPEVDATPTNQADVISSETLTDQPSPDAPSLTEAFESLLSLFNTPSNNAQVEFGTEDVASLDWSTPVPAAQEDTAKTNSTSAQPTKLSSEDEPDLLRSIFSFFESFSLDHTDQINHGSDEFDQTEIGLHNSLDKIPAERIEAKPSETVSLTPEIAMSDAANDFGTFDGGIFEFLSSLFSLDTIAKNVKYSELEEDPTEELGR